MFATSPNKQDYDITWKNKQGYYFTWKDETELGTVRAYYQVLHRSYAGSVFGKDESCLANVEGVPGHHPDIERNPHEADDGI